jgi:uncharacterized repeat protein (TIGR02543 family)
MKSMTKFLGITAVLAVIVFTMTGCPDSGDDDKTSVTPPVVLPSLEGNVTISPNSGVVTGMELTAGYDGTEEDVTVAWQWNKGGTAINGATNSTYTPNEGGSYTVTANASGYNSKTSAAVAVTLFTPVAGLYKKAPPIMPGDYDDTDVYINAVTANNVAAAVTYVNGNTGTYTLIINTDVDAGPQTLNVANVKLTIIGIGGEKKISLSANGALFALTNSAELTIGNDITLVGCNANNSSVVNVKGGAAFTMLTGSKVTGNTANASDDDRGSAVLVDGGAFTMNGGAITGNAVNHTNGQAAQRTGGLRVNNSTQPVNLNGGSITGNTGSASELDVVLTGAPFTLSGSAVIGGIGFYSGTPTSVITIASNWSGSIGKLNLFGNSGDLNGVINGWDNQSALQGEGLNAAAVARVTPGDFYANIGVGSAGLKQSITTTHKLGNTVSDMGKLVRIGFSTAPVLSLSAGNAKLTYTWTASNPAADSYDVYWKMGNNLSVAEVKTGAKITGATSSGEITGLTNDTAYSVIVVANKAGYTGNINSEVKTGTPLASCVVTFNSNGGSEVTSQTINGGGKVSKPVDPTKTGGYECIFDGWYKESALTNEWVFATDTVTAPITLYAKWKAYQLGDTGPGGGKIFYRIETGFTQYLSATDTEGTTAYYLEVAPAIITTTLTWASPAHASTIISTGNEIGNGRKNTALILNTDVDAPAAKACVDYRGPNNLTDWFLPSLEEARSLQTNRSYVDGSSFFGSYYYLTSSEYIPGYVRTMQLGGYGMSDSSKTSVNRVIAIRAF